MKPRKVIMVVEMTTDAPMADLKAEFIPETWTTDVGGKVRTIAVEQVQFNVVRDEKKKGKKR